MRGIPMGISRINSLPLSPNQHGFRSNHSTVSALLPLAHKIAQGFNQPCPPLRILTKTIDLTKVFDMVNHTKLIREGVINHTKRANSQLPIKL